MLAQKEVYANPRIAVAHFDVLKPAGKKGIYGTVHFRNKAIGIVPLDDGNTWFVGPKRFPLSVYSWEIPEGGGPLDEDPVAAAKRELAEEIGLVAVEWMELQNFDISNSVIDEKGIVFLARKLRQDKATPEDTEQLFIKKLPFAEVARMVEQGKIKEAVIVIAIMKVQLPMLQGKI